MSTKIRISEKKMNEGLETLCAVLRERLRGEKNVSVRRYLKAKISVLQGEGKRCNRPIRSISFLY